jgi:hypothetical protein
MLFKKKKVEYRWTMKLLLKKSELESSHSACRIINYNVFFVKIGQ